MRAAENMLSSIACSKPSLHRSKSPSQPLRCVSTLSSSFKSSRTSVISASADLRVARIAVEPHGFKSDAVTISPQLARVKPRDSQRGKLFHKSPDDRCLPPTRWSRQQEVFGFCCHLWLLPLPIRVCWVGHWAPASKRRGHRLHPTLRPAFGPEPAVLVVRHRRAV